jgi:hypothetical protein
MNQLFLLYGLRLLSAVVLLAFIVLLAWLVYQDLRLSSTSVQQQRVFGHLRVIASEDTELGEDMLYPLLPVTSIGRAQGNTIVIDDGFISSHHVLINLREGQWWLEDMGSRNGTFLNDHHLVEPAVISWGDIIVMGSTQLTIEPDPSS